MSCDDPDGIANLPRSAALDLIHLGLGRTGTPPSLSRLCGLSAPAGDSVVRNTDRQATTRSPLTFTFERSPDHEWCFSPGRSVESGGG